MVLHAKAGDVEQLDALGGAIVKVHVGEADAAKAFVSHNGCHSALDPKAQVALGRMLAHATRELGYQVSQAGEHQTKAVVLRRDFNTTREQIHNRLVAAAMSELELLDLRTRRKADHLVAQADAEHRHLANKLLDLHVCLGYGIGIAGTVGEEHAVWVLGKNILCGGIPRHNGEVAAGAN